MGEKDEKWHDFFSQAITKILNPDLSPELQVSKLWRRVEFPLNTSQSHSG
jgi:hypothetical protein